MTDSSHLFRRERTRETADRMDTTAYETNDGRSSSRTMLLGQDAESREKQEYYSYLAKLNDDMYTSSRDWENVKADRRRLIQTYGAHLELSTLQCNRVKHIMQNISMMFGKYPYEQVLLALVSIVCDETGRNVRRESMYQELMENVGVTEEQISRLRELSMERIVDADEIILR